MAAITGTVALEEHRLAAEHPLAVAIAIAAVGEIVNLLAVSLDESDVGVVPSAVADIAGEEPLAVWTPLKPDVAIGVRVVVLAVEHGAHLLRLQVDDAQGGTVFVECHLLAIGTVGRILRGEIGLGELFLLDVGGISKVLLLLVLDFRLENLPYAIALGGIDETSAVWGETQVALLLRRVGDALGGLVFGRSDIYVAVHDEGYLLAVRREGNLCGSPRADLTDEARLIVVGGDGDVDLLRLCALLDGVDFAIVAIAEQTILG